jgi:hypothetical protein
MQAPKPGTVMGNHVYVGGDPGDQKSWRHVGALNQDFGEAQDKMGRINRAKGPVSGETANGLGIDMRTGMMGNLLSAVPGTPSYNMKADLAPVMANTTLGTIAEAKQGGASLGVNPTDRDAAIYAKAVQNLDDLGVPAQQYLNELNVAGGFLERRYPGLTPDQPLILQEGRSRADLPKGAFYQDPQGNVRRNDNADRGNPIIRKPPPIPQPPGVKAAAPAIPPAAVDYLRQNNTPQNRAYFDQTFGAGSAQRYLSGR